MQTPVAGDLVKNAGAISWSAVDSSEAALVQRCAAGEESACAELVTSHQRMVFGLAWLAIIVTVTVTGASDGLVLRTERARVISF